MNKTLFLPLYFFGDISYWIHYLESDEVILVTGENYAKQSQRNHTWILGPNGKQKLTVPVIGQKGDKLRLSEIKIHKDSEYRKSHLNSIRTAYGTAPFFESFYPLIEEVYAEDHDLIVDLNLKINTVIAKIIKPKSRINVELLNLPISNIATKPAHSYPQVFSYKFGFTPNLSVMDLIFNEGRYARNYLKKLLTLD